MKRVERWLRRAARKRPAHPALLHQGARLSYADLEARVQERAGQLRAAGLGEGDRLAVLMENDVECVYAIHAAMLLGATLVPIHARFTPVEIRTLLEDARPRLLLSSAPLEAAAVRAAEALEGIAVLPAPELARLPSKPGRSRDVLRLDDDQAILFTSGTTGRPKGVRLTHANQLASALASAERLGVDPDDRWLACMPLYHVGGLAIALRSVIYQTTLALQPRFDVAAVAHAWRGERITLTSLVPTMLARVLDAIAEPPPTLRCVLLGGGPIPPELLLRARRAGVPVAPTYGLTEAASQVATATPAEVQCSDAFAGARPLASTELRIVAPDGTDEPHGSPGEILVRGPQVMAGYLDRPGDTARALRDGWLHTGDLGVLDTEGRLSVLDRREDLIITGGENVYPTEVEASLLTHPDVAEAAVIARADPEWGQIVAALVVPRPGRAPSGEALRAHSRARLAAFKVPREIELLERLPRTASGKLRREALRRSSRL